jgi:hypothetical protein
MSQCTARSKRTKERCRHAAMHNKRVCYHHGGMTPTGYGLPQTKHGRYSKVLPVRLAQKYEEALANKDLLSVRDDVAVCESRLADLFRRVDSGESGQRWQDVLQTFEAFSTALAARDGAAMNRHLVSMRRLITQGSDDAAVWGEIQALWESRCRLTLTEAKTLVMAQQMVTVEQLMVYLGVITDAIQRTVAAHTEAPVARTILKDLSAEFGRIGLSAAGGAA